MVNWLLEKDVFEENLDDLKKAIEQQGHTFTTCGYEPFGSKKDLGSYFKSADCVIFYGSLGFGRQVKLEAWVPGVYCDLPKFECSYYYPRVRQFLLNDRYFMLPFGDLANRRTKEFILDTVGNNGAVFMRPDGGDKLFSGTVVTVDTWDADMRLIGFYDPPPESIIVVAEPTNLKEEWRLVVADGVVAAGSQYKDAGKLAILSGFPNDVKEYADEIIRHWAGPERCYVMDIARTKFDELKLIEYNSFSCSGLYACDKGEIVRAVSVVAQSDWNEAWS